MVEVGDALVAAAVRAFRRTRFYSELYGTEPADESAIPYISASDYHRAAGVLDCVADREAIIGVLPPFCRDASRFPFTAPEDEAELALRQQRIVRAMQGLGVDFAAGPRFLIVTDGRRGPFACEVAKGFYWEGFQTCLSFAADTGERLRRDVAALEPDYVVLASSRHLRRGLGRPRHTVWLVEHCGDTPIEDVDYPSLLYADGVDLVGSRAAGRAGYDHDAGQLRLEVDPASGLTHVTKVRFTLFPLVRYGLGRWVPTAETSKGESP